MAQRFRRTRRGIEASLDAVERELLSRLLADVHDLLDDGGSDPEPGEDSLAALLGISEHARTPEDPALARLLPEGSRDDRELAQEFRRLTDHGLRVRKREALRVARRTLEREGPLRLDDAEARSWVTALTDIRLVLGERLGLRTDEDAERLAALLADADEDDQQAWLAAVYDFLTWMQETLVTVLLQGLPEEGRGAGR